MRCNQKLQFFCREVSFRLNLKQLCGGRDTIVYPYLKSSYSIKHSKIKENNPIFESNGFYCLERVKSNLSSLKINFYYLFI